MNLWRAAGENAEEGKSIFEHSAKDLKNGQEVGLLFDATASSSLAMPVTPRRASFLSQVPLSEHTAKVALVVNTATEDPDSDGQFRQLQATSSPLAADAAC